MLFHQPSHPAMTGKVFLTSCDFDLFHSHTSLGVSSATIFNFEDPCGYASTWIIKYNIPISIISLIISAKHLLPCKETHSQVLKLKRSLRGHFSTYHNMYFFFCFFIQVSTLPISMSQVLLIHSVSSAFSQIWIIISWNNNETLYWSWNEEEVRTCNFIQYLKGYLTYYFWWKGLEIWLQSRPKLNCSRTWIISF